MSLFKNLILRVFANKKPNVNFNFKNVSSVLIRPMGHSVGDTVAHIAYIRQLKTLYPHCKIGVFTNARSLPIYQCCRLIDVLLDDSFTTCLKNRKKWQVHLDFYETYNSTHIIKTGLLAPDINIIFGKGNKKYYNADNVKNYDFHCPPPPNAHIATYLTTSIFNQYFPVAEPDVSLELSTQTLHAADAYWLNGHDKKYRILLAPQGSEESRCIPASELAGLLNGCDPKHIAQAQFVLCNTRNSQAYLEELKSLCRKDICLNLSPETSLSQYLSLVTSSDMAICVDSGTVHLACAFKKPLLGFYANNPANISKWYPMHHKDVPSLMVVSDLPAPSKETRHFPLAEAITWMNARFQESEAAKP
ncbi:MAG: glycosyltransferase family 9 protein [Neisseria zoodegmatis]|uniref:glycosyltransferase family 9 protein n=1 Tax=Neisseria zoodegmatis TaxID=326523 RepID=UPI0026E97AF1|nr:glycosyltransferase family 9 protein [Neisseria zoodegmatis]MDO5068977.1 glycosyltransferase family 9 protein [Neisseria zoodegmatis]